MADIVERLQEKNWLLIPEYGPDPRQRVQDAIDEIEVLRRIRYSQSKVIIILCGELKQLRESVSYSCKRIRDYKFSIEEATEEMGKLEKGLSKMVEAAQNG